MEYTENSPHGDSVEERSSADCQRQVFDELDSLRTGMRSNSPHLTYGIAIASTSDVPIEQITDYLRTNAFDDVLGQSGVRMSSAMTLSTTDSTRSDEDYSARLESVIRQEASSFLPSVIESEMVQCSDWYGMIIGVDVDSFRANLIVHYENEYFDIVQSEDSSPVERLNRLVLLGTVMSDAMLSNLPFPSLGRSAISLLADEIRNELRSIDIVIEPDGGVVASGTRIAISAFDSMERSVRLRGLPLTVVAVPDQAPPVTSIPFRDGASDSLAVTPFSEIDGTGPVTVSVNLDLSSFGRAVTTNNLVTADFVLSPLSSTSMASRVRVIGSVLLSGVDSRDFPGRDPDEYDRETVDIPTLYWTKTEITNGQYQEYLQSVEGVREPAFWNAPGIGADEPDLPVVGISVTEAMAYAHWVGGRLPTEYEWEFTARNGGTTLYPWGNEPQPESANTSSDSKYENLAPVGSFPTGMNTVGILDLCGNASEWTFSAASEESNRPAAVVRGGSYLDPIGEAVATNRVNKDPNGRYPDVGFRVVWDINQ